MRLASIPWALVLILGACGPAAGGDDGNGGGDGGNGNNDGGGPRPDAGSPPLMAKVYAHSASTLYSVDPDTLDVQMVGPFQWPGTPDSMTDIAIDKDGFMVGISFNRVYAVDKDTAACTYLADLQRQFNGLSFIPAEQVDPNSDEILVGSALDGSFWKIDPITGTSTLIGNYGGGLTSSGDIVAVSGVTYATVKMNGVGDDYLARVEPTTGVATVVGPTGVTDIWGVGFWGDKVYGFTDNQQFVLIDRSTGAATPVEMGGVRWWGAGVTTAAPVIE